MSDTIFNLIFASLIFWSCFLLCDLSLKRTSSGLYVYMIIAGVYVLDCAMYYFTAFSGLPYAWYIFALFPILVLPLLYKNQLPIIIFTYMSSMLFSFIIQTVVKIATYVIYLNYPTLFVQFDSAFVLMIAMCVYLILIPALLRFAFEKIAKHSSSRAMLLTWIYPIVCLAVLLINDYQDVLYTSTIIRYMGALLVIMVAVYVIFYMMLTSEKPLAPAIAVAPARVQLERPAQPYKSNNNQLIQYERQYFESLINAYNDTLDRTFVIEKGLQTVQRMIRDNNTNEAMRVLTQLQDGIKDIQLLNVTENTVVDTLLSYYHYLFSQDGLNLKFNIVLPESNALRELDYCILFGSLLQNAYDMLYESRVEHGGVVLESKIDANMLLVTCSNTFLGDASSIQKASSNFNLTCVRELCNSHRGTLQVECPQDIFYAYVDIAI